MVKKRKKSFRKKTDPKAAEAMGKALIEFGKKEYKEGKLDKESAKIAIHDAANHFIEAAEGYGIRNSRIKAKKNYQIAKKIYNQEIVKSKIPIKKEKTTNKFALIVSILSILTGILSIFSAMSNKISLSPGIGPVDWTKRIGYCLILIGLGLGISWFYNNK